MGSLISKPRPTSSRRPQDSEKQSEEVVENGIKPSSVQNRCVQCEKKGKVTKAIWICKHCGDELLCEDCHKAHKKIKRNKKHETESLLNIGAEFCKIHKGRRIDYFCTLHGEYCCNTCLAEYHKDCKDVASMAKPRAASLITEFEALFPGDKEVPDVVATAFLQDSRLLLVDASNRKLKVFGSDFGVLYGKHFESDPWGIAVNESIPTEVAIVLPNEQRIVKLSIEKPIEEKWTMKTEFKCHAVSYLSKTSLLVTSATTNEVAIVDTKGIKGKPTVIPIHEDIGKTLLDEPRYISVDSKKSKAYISNYRSDTIIGVDLSTKNVLFKCASSDFDGLVGITTSVDGYIYVCDRPNDIVCQITLEGVIVGNILSEKNGMKKPMALAFSPDGEQLVVVCSNSPLVKVFRIT